MGTYKTSIKFGGNSKTKSKGLMAKPIVSTSRPADTCAEGCAFRGTGIDHKPSEGGTSCYGANKPGGGKSLFQIAENKGETDTARAFRVLGDNTPPTATVRHLEVGDIKTPAEGDDYIEQANKFHADNPRTKGHGYTHNHENLDPTSVKGWTLRASTETRGQAEDAVKRGWNPVIESPANDMLSARGERIAGKPVRQCPAQTHPEKVGCANCNMCRNENTVVEFKIHGTSNKINEGRIRDIRHAERDSPVNLGMPSMPARQSVTSSSSPDGDSTDADTPSRNSGFITGFSGRNV
jgi:hypothetical protein